jgi:hypothetical protein
MAALGLIQEMDTLELIGQMIKETDRMVFGVSMKMEQPSLIKST